MEIFETMRTASAIRRFRPDPVPDEVLQRCLQAATWAPSGGNQQRWRFVVLRSAPVREAVAVGAQRALDVIRNVYRIQDPAADDDSPRARSARAVIALHENARNVPLAVLFTMKPDPAVNPELQGASIFPGVQNFLLALRAEGLGGLITGWASGAEAELRQVIGIPEDWDLSTLVVAGWPQGQHRPVRRRPLADVARLDTWDNPLS